MIRVSLFKVWDWKLLFSIFLFLVLPSIYRSYGIYLIGNTPPGEQNLAVVSQWQFVQVLYEILQEALIFPIFFFVGSQRKSGQNILFQRIQASILFLLILLAPLTVLLWSGMDLFVGKIGTDVAIQNLTTIFLRIKVAALFIGVLSSGLIIVIEALRRKRLLLKLLVVKLFLFVFLDSLFFGNYSFSLGWGAVGMGLSHLLTEIVLFAVAAYHLYNWLGVPPRNWLQWPSRQSFRVFSGISGWIALESFIRNATYFFLILRFLNQLGPAQVGGYYLSMHLFWSFCLLPINVIAETMKVQFANEADNLSSVRNIFWSGLALGIPFLLLWIFPLVYQTEILRAFSNDPAIVQSAQQAFTFLFFAYLLLALNILMDTLFIGLGKTVFLAYQSVITNLGVYGAAMVFYHQGYWTLTFSNVLLLFTLGIVIDSGLTVAFARNLLKS